MRRTVQTAMAAIVLLLAVSNGAAQWVKNVTPGIPRTADGSVNMVAPVPRTADGRPDLSGVWRWSGRNYMDGVDVPAQPWTAELAKRRAEGDGKDDPTALCLPWGIPRFTAFSLQKIFQTTHVVVMLYEFNTTFRQVFTDGRPHPINPQPSWMGYSVGRWDGDTLVIETTGFNGQSWLDSTRGFPLTEAARVTERLLRTDFGTIDARITIDDPKAYTRPFDVHVTLRFQDTDLIEYVCNENEKYVSGTTVGK